MSVSTTSIQLGDILLLVHPYASALFSMMLTVVTPIIAAKIYRLFGVRVTDAQWAVVHSAALAAAGKFWAAADTSIAKARIDLGSPGIAAAAQAAIDAIPAVAARLGLDPEAMASLIVSKIGLLQSAGVGSSVGAGDRAA
jgi:hypothetical protein